MPESIHKDVPLLSYNTFHVAASAKFFAIIRSTQELTELIKAGITDRYPPIILGGGSNILFTKDFPGLVLHNRIESIRTIEEKKKTVLLEAGSGVEWDKFVRYCTDHHYYGAENLSLIPGTVGAAAVQNIGAYGSEAADIILSVTGRDLKTGKQSTLSSTACRFGYRRSIFKTSLAQSFFITSVRFRLRKLPHLNLSYPALARELNEKTKPDVRKVRDAVIRIRRNKLPDPEETGNAGSFFKNPVIPANQWKELLKREPDIPSYQLPDDRVKIPAAWLIEQAGWKDKPSRSCAVWYKQPLVIINRGHALGQEIAEYAKEMQKSIEYRFGILLEPEVLIL